MSTPSKPHRPRIGYVVSQYPAVNHTFILREIRSLRELGYPIEVISIRRPDRPMERLSAVEQEEARATTAILGLGAAGVLRENLGVLFRRPAAYLAGLLYALQLSAWDLRKMAQYLIYFAEAATAGAILERRGIAHVHTHFSSTVVLILAKIFPIRYSMTIHGPAEFDDVVGFHMKEKVAQAEFVVTISKYGASQVMKPSAYAHWHKVHDVPLGVDPATYQMRPPPLTSRELPFHITSVGRLEPPKGHAVLIEAIGELVRRGHKNVRLTIVGQGALLPELREAVERFGLQEYVELPGAKNHDVVLEYYRRSHVFAMASFAEGIPVVLMEAMAMEIPCVATFITGIPELIHTGQDGLLVPPSDPQELANAISRLIADPAEAERMGRAGRQQVIENFHLQKNAARLAAIFDGYLASEKQNAADRAGSLKVAAQATDLN